MFIVAESGSAIFNIDTSTIISIYKFKAGDEEKWAVCCDYSVNDDDYHLLTNKTENREVAVAVLGRIAEALKKNVKLLDLSDYYPNCSVVNADKNIKKGKWETICHGELLVCSRCGHEPPNKEMSAHCPHCGARMESERK